MGGQKAISVGATVEHVVVNDLGVEVVTAASAIPECAAPMGSLRLGTCIDPTDALRHSGLASVPRPPPESRSTVAILRR